ncbi:hypothetical protein BDQ12DRAFT_562876, partial [Crucibulum laeve]
IKFLSNNIAHGAFHNSGERFDPPKCHARTREAVLRKIMDWAGETNTSSPILWMYGPAGSGKSAIAQTISETCYAKKRLIGSYFFSRTVPKRNSAKNLIATLAYQMSLSIPQTRPILNKIVDNDTSILHLSLEIQIEVLIIRPLIEAVASCGNECVAWPNLIIIDGLDECSDHNIQRAIIVTLSSSIRNRKVPLSILITSRPERSIRNAFNLPEVNNISLSLVLDDSFNPDSDIKIFLVDKFDEIKHQHPLAYHIKTNWPSEDEISQLVSKSSGQFIYAATTMKFVGSYSHRPQERLNIILGLSVAGNEVPFAELDCLYRYIL